MKKYDKILSKIKSVDKSIRWKDLQFVFNKKNILYKDGAKHSKKVYIGTNVWTLHPTKNSLDPGSIKILKDIMEEEKIL